MNTGVIVNPRSTGGATGKRWPPIAAALRDRLGPLTVRFTERAGHATELARGLLQQGFDRIIGAGGDGTFNEIANGFLTGDEPVRPGACLGVLPMGTGSDFQRTLGISSKPLEAIEVLATGTPLEIDLGKISFKGHDGEQRIRYFVNVVSFGMGGDVSARAKNVLSPLGGKIAFLYATVLAFLTYRGKRVELRVDGETHSRSHTVLNVAVGNGCFHGGGMHVCPGAILNDGLLEITVIDDLGIFTLLKDKSYLYDGNIYAHPKVLHFRATGITATSPETTRIEVDGEHPGTLPLTITVLPRRLKVIVPRESALLG